MAHHLLSDPDRFDVDAYFARIGYHGPRTATLAVLRELHGRHAQAIAFENLNPLLRWPVRLDTASLVQKFIREGRGGYCFEHNLLFAHALHALGFEFGGLAGRVVYGQPAGTITARTHMLLRIELEGTTWIADVGFGALTLTAPVTLTPGVEQLTPHEPFRLTEAGAGYVLEARVRDDWTPLYRFSEDPAYLPDYETASWYLCHYPESHFITGLVAARPVPDRRYALRNNQFVTYHRDGRLERELLSSGQALREVLEGPFGLRVPRAPEVDVAFARITAPAAAAVRPTV